MTQRIVGLIGLGNMGGPMARNLARAGFALVVDDADKERARAIAAETGGAAAEGPAAFGQVDILITMLPNGTIVREALFGAAGVAVALRAGCVVVDMSSSDPAVYPKLRDKLEAQGVGLIDAPVSGSVSGAVNATLSIMAGGPSELIDKAEPALQALGQRIFRTGALGTGQVMKALNNLVSAGGLILAVEALLVGKRLGLDPKLMNDILNVSTGRNNSTERKIEPYVLSGAFNSGFGLALMAKDLRTARSVAEAGGLAPPLSALCVELANRAAEALGPEADHTEVARWVAAELGQDF